MTGTFGRWMLALMVAGMAMALWLTGAAHAQEAAGAWHGALALPTGEIRVGVKLKRAPGGLEGVIFSPDQTGRDALLTEVKQDGRRLSFAYPAVRGRFEGDWDPAKSAWVGTWTNVNGPYPLTLLKGDVPPGPVVAGLDGDWVGAIEAGGMKLRLVLHVRTGPYGTVATLDSPDQLAMGLPIADLTRTGSQVSFVQKAARGTFEGALAADGKTIVGEWSQGRSLPLTFTRGAAVAERKRPQVPVKPYPYHEEEVAFDSVPGVRLAGTLTLPPGTGPFPAAVLISGSGAQDRDEALLGHRPFLVLADRLTRNGVAVLRYDDRGFARSTGDFAKATTADFAKDAAAAVAYLRTRSEIDKAHIGLIGHSEGGVIAPMVAGSDPKIGFVVLMAAPGGNLAALLDSQRAALGPYAGASPEAVTMANKLMADALQAMQGAKDDAEAEGRARAVLAAADPRLRLTPAMVDQQAKMLGSAWMRELLATDTRPILAKVTQPVLALNGSKDLQVPVKENLPEVQKALTSSKDVIAVELEGLNHLFQTATTGAVGEYADIEETIAPSALALIVEWVVAHTKR